jgi:hypothetical protein
MPGAQLRDEIAPLIANPVDVSAGEIREIRADPSGLGKPVSRACLHRGGAEADGQE